MEPELYTRVALTRDIPEASLKQGEAGAILEVSNAIGESIAVVTVPISAIEPLRANPIPAVRTRAE